MLIPGNDYTQNAHRKVVFCKSVLSVYEKPLPDGISEGLQQDIR